ncbi:hypothetical protein VTN31DRAFT_4438 [Thermomyces dupontii]|uniref:uncharacterized protein n=1 Tax=Talaromyces thermophilus TaxID=28565 RepID=UPI0037426102
MAHQLDTTLAEIKPIFPPKRGLGQPAEEPRAVRETIQRLGLQAHVEGGYFVETDRDPRKVPNPFLDTKDPGIAYELPEEQRTARPEDDSTRSASTTIYYYLTPGSPLGCFHRNRGRTVHTLHRGRGRYVLIHADEVMRGDRKEHGNKARIETFVVGHDIARGERLQWIVEGGKYKATFLLPDTPDGKESEGLLISETVVPGFDFGDHDFMQAKTLHELLTPDEVRELEWLLREKSIGL